MGCFFKLIKFRTVSGCKKYVALVTRRSYYGKDLVREGFLLDFIVREIAVEKKTCLRKRSERPKVKMNADTKIIDIV